MWALILAGCGLPVGWLLGGLLSVWLVIETDNMDDPPILLWSICVLSTFAHSALGFFIGRKIDRGRSGE